MDRTYNAAEMMSGKKVQTIPVVRAKQVDRAASHSTWHFTYETLYNLMFSSFIRAYRVQNIEGYCTSCILRESLILSL